MPAFVPAFRSWRRLIACVGQVDALPTSATDQFRSHVEINTYGSSHLKA